MSNKTERYIEREKKFIYTTTVDKSIVLTKGQGIKFVDLDGREFIDATAQISLLNTGFNPREVAFHILDQLEHGVYSCISADWAYVNELPNDSEISRAALAEKLVRLTDSVMPVPNKKVMFEVSGATAISAAGRIASITYLRQKGDWDTEKLGKFFLHQDIFIPSHHDPFRFSFLGFKNAFHGRHDIAKLLTDSKAVHYWGPSSSCAVGRLTLPCSDWNNAQMIYEVGEIIKKLKNYAPVITFFFEPIQGESGINVPDSGGLKNLIQYLRERGIWIIADEIQSGLGRTGKMFACEHFDIQPDMIILSKSLGAGLPIGAVIANADVFPDLEPGMHSGSMHCSPLSCAAALVNLPLIEKYIPNSAEKGECALHKFKDMKRKYPDVIKDVRGKGLFIGIEFFDIWKRNKVVQIAKTVYDKTGLLLAPAGESTVRFCPPIIIEYGDLNTALYIFELSLKEL